MEKLSEGINEICGFGVIRKREIGEGG